MKLIILYILNFLLLFNSADFTNKPILDEYITNITKYYDDIERNLLEAIGIINNTCNITSELKYELQLVDESDFLMAVVPTRVYIDDTVYSPWMVEHSGYTDATIYINKNINWEFTDNLLDNTKYHMRTVFLHELIHIMGFISYIYPNKSSQYYTQYDKLIRYNSTDLIYYNNNSSDWIGKNIFIKNVKLYNPDVFIDGSSISHINTYNSVMRYSIGKGKIINKLDNDIITILNELNWNCSFNDNDNTDIVIIIDDNNDNNNNRLDYIIILLLIILLSLVLICTFLYFDYSDQNTYSQDNIRLSNISI